MHNTRSVPSVAALLGVLALTPNTAQANPAHHGDSTQLSGQSAEAGAPQSAPQSQSGQAVGGMMGGGMMAPGAAPEPGMGSSMMGPDMMRMMQMHGLGGGMMGPGTGGPGMMGLGMMSGGLGPCGGMAGDRDLSADQVKDILEGQLAWLGNKRLKVGKVEKKDDDSYLAEIVTVDDSLVQTLAIDRKTGAMRPIK